MVEINGKMEEKTVKYVEYDMESYLNSAVEHYQEVYEKLTGQKCVLKPVKTPFLNEDTKDCPARRPGDCCPMCERPFDAANGQDGDQLSPGSGNDCNDPAAAAVDQRAGMPQFKTRSGKSKGKKKKTTVADLPGPEENPQDADRGRLHIVALSILMQILYSARLARHDLLRPTLRLASLTTKWDSDCDKKLHRLMRYINCTPKKRLIGWCADKLEDCSPHGYAGSDFAGCDKTLRSTSGASLIMQGNPLDSHLLQEV